MIGYGGVDGQHPPVLGYEAARELAAKGYTMVKVLAGGIVAWSDAGYPVEK